MKTVAFYQPFLNERGTSVAMFDYALYNEKILKNKSVIIYDELDSRNVKNAIENFKKHFSVFGFKCNTCSVNERNNLIDDIVDSTKSEFIYMTKWGINDGIVSKKAKTIIQCISRTNPEVDYHGDIYSYGSYWLSQYCSNGKIPAVPYMVTLPEHELDMRERLNIPSDAIVFGRHGGEDTFDLRWGYPAIKAALDYNDKIYFLLLNTQKFIDHPRVIHLETIIDNKEKVEFINSCDAMLHLRYIGESFGLACAEFSIRNKPIITYFGSEERNHIDILGDKGFYYNNPQELFNILINFNVDKDKDWNCYRDYSPENIMKIFDEVYLQ